jgi:hypothetical protein
VRRAGGKRPTCAATDFNDTAREKHSRGVEPGGLDEVRRRLSGRGNEFAVEGALAALDAIAARFGTGTADVVAMQLEYPRETAGR